MITVVTGLPRSGTTLAMMMLEAGGIPAYFNPNDPLHQALRETPKHSGLPDDHDWVKECEGMVLKNLMPCFYQLPKNFEYRFIWMDRDSKEHAKSNRKFIYWLKRVPLQDIGSKRDFIKRHERFTKKGLDFLKTYPHFRLTHIRFESILNNPTREAERMAEFLEKDLDIQAMIDVVIPRSPRCQKGFLELERNV